MQYQDHHYYHIYNRGAGRAKIFYSDRNYRHCIDLMEKNKFRYKISLIAFCFMPNHYHLILIQKDGGSVSRFLQTVFNSYTQAVNNELKRSGTLFEGRAKKIRIDTDAHLFQVIRYIHMNPVNAELVSKPEYWRYSDYRCWIGSDDTILTDLELRNDSFNTGLQYKSFVEEYQMGMMDEETSKYLLE